MIQFENGTYFAYETVGEFHSSGPWIHPTRRIRSIELILVLEGTVYLREGERAFTLTENQMLLLEPGLEHGGTQVVDMPTAFYWLHFYTDRPLPFKIFDGPDYYDIKVLLKRLLHITNTPGYTREAADALACLIFEELVRQGKAEVQTARVDIRQILEYIRIHTRQNFTVAQLAAHFNYNTDYLGKLFRKHLGMGLKEYLAQQRLKLAKELLLTTELTVKEIAEELGCSNENLFVKFFLYHEKISPVSFRGRYCHTHMNSR